MTPIVASQPLERVVMDVLGPLRVSESGNKYIIIFTDHFTKWTAAVAMPDQLAATVADALVEHVILCVGPMHTLASDQGTNFLSQVVEEVCELFGTRQMQSVAYRPQTQGLVERFNRTLLSMLRCYVNQDCEDWDKFLPYLIYAYNTSPNRVTGDTPFRLMFGRDPKPFIRLPQPNPEKTVKSYSEYRETLEARLLEAHELAQKASLAEYQKMKDYLTKHTRLVEYRVGDLVWLKRMAFPSNLHRKLSRKYTGPWRILRICGPNLEIVPLSFEAEPRRVHRDHVKPMFLYRESLSPSLESPSEAGNPVVEDLTDCDPGVEPTLPVPEVEETPEEVHAEDRFAASQQYYDPMAFLKQPLPIRVTVGGKDFLFENMDEAKVLLDELRSKNTERSVKEKLLRGLVEAPDSTTPEVGDSLPGTLSDDLDVSFPGSLGETAPGAEHLPGGSGEEERLETSATGYVIKTQAEREAWEALANTVRKYKELHGEMECQGTPAQVQPNQEAWDAFNATLRKRRLEKTLEVLGSGYKVRSQAEQEAWDGLAETLRAMREREKDRVDPVDDVDPIWERVRKGHQRKEEAGSRYQLRKRVKPPPRLGHD